MADAFTDALIPSEQRRITAGFESISERREVIDLATGMLTVIYGIDADEALGLLRRQSQLHNVKVYLLSAQIVDDLVQLGESAPLDQDNADGVVLTAYQRTGPMAQRARKPRVTIAACDPPGDDRSPGSSIGARR